MYIRPQDSRLRLQVSINYVIYGANDPELEDSGGFNVSQHNQIELTPTSESAKKQNLTKIEIL
jgi:hypothetical protein